MTSKWSRYISPSLFKSLCKEKFKYSVLICFSHHPLLRLNSMRSTSWLMPTGPATLTCRCSEMGPRLSGETHKRRQKRREDLSTKVSVFGQFVIFLLSFHFPGHSSQTLSSFVNMPSVWPRMKTFATWSSVCSTEESHASTPWSPSITCVTSHGR